MKLARPRKRNLCVYAAQHSHKLLLIRLSSSSLSSYPAGSSLRPFHALQPAARVQLPNPALLFFFFAAAGPPPPPPRLRVCLTPPTPAPSFSCL